jgi:hypothetical protein
MLCQYPDLESRVYKSVPASVILLYRRRCLAKPPNSNGIQSSLQCRSQHLSSYLPSPLLNSNPSNRPSNNWLTSPARFLTPHILAFAPLVVPTLPTSLPAPLNVPSVCPCSGTSPPCISLSCIAGVAGRDELPDVIFRGGPRCCDCWNGEGNTLEGPMATNNNPLDSARMHMMPYSSWMVMQLRSFSELRMSREVGDGGRDAATREEVLALKGW